jgi:Ca2+-binding EF-hand superfamily protein
MGCVNSIQVLAEANEYGKDIDPEWHEQFEALKLTTQELNRLYKAFVSYDLDESKGMDYAELLTALNLSKNRFTTRAFSVFDLDGDGELNFKEFVLSFWNVCTLNKETLYSLAFNLWDADSSGGISPKEINKALKEVYGKDKEFSEQDLEKVIRKSVAGRNFQKDITAEGIIIREQDFYLFTKHRPQLMQPALQLQHAMMTSVLGKGFWDAQALKRKKMIDEQTAGKNQHQIVPCRSPSL